MVYVGVDGPGPVLWWGAPWADILTATFTALTLFLAIVIAKREHSKSREEQAKARELDERAQASRVFAWFTVRPVGVVRDDPVPPASIHTLHVHNASGLPVFDVAIVQEPTFTEGDVLLRRRVLMPSDEPETRLDDEEMPVQEASVELAEMSFRDAAGRWWKRTVDGELHRLTTAPERTGEQYWI